MFDTDKLISYLRLVRAYIKLNWSIQMEYKGAFISQFMAMFLNNSTWLVFWLMFFDRFTVVKGWGRDDVMTLWAVAAAGFGLSSVFFNNLQNLAALITRGELDAWLLYPRALLPHLALGKMSATALGDLAFGYFVYIFLVRPDAAHLALFILLTVSVAVLFTGFNLIRGSLGFFLGNGELLSEQWFFAMITFSTYPSCLFDGAARIVLFTAIPAIFVAGYPVEALRSPLAGGHILEYTLYSLAGALSILAFGIFVFHLGLSRYQSGSLMEMRK